MNKALMGWLALLGVMVLGGLIAAVQILLRGLYHDQPE
jgi:hypothetical protein